MKKLIIIAACAAAAVSGFAQGTVAFQNTATSAIYLGSSASSSNKVTSAALSTGGVIDVGLFWSTSQFNTIAGGTLAGVQTIGTTAGLVAGTQVFSLGAGSNPNDTDFIQVFAWDSTYGNNALGAEAALVAGGYFGAFSAGNANTTYGAIGAAYSVILGATAGPGTPIFTPTGSIGKCIVLQNSITPEPTTIALGGLGAAAMLLFRRRK
jgi:hypothetical protein